MRIARSTALGATIAMAVASCSLFLEDLSGGEAPVDDGGPGRDDVTPTDAAPTDDVRAPDAPPVGDANAGTDADAAPDAPKWIPRLDCDATVLCDDFENVAAFTDGIPTGVWDQVTESQGNASVDTNDPALGTKCAKFTSPANTGGAALTLLIANNDLPLPAGTVTVQADFDMWLDYVPSAFDGVDRRNLVGLFIVSSKAASDWEYAGLSIQANKGMHVEIRRFASASSTTRIAGEDPHAELTNQALRGAWHHYRFEATFAKSAVGGVKVFVDGVKAGEFGGLVTRTNATDSVAQFIFWIGAGAGAGSPALTARYDNVEVRTR